MNFIIEAYTRSIDHMCKLCCTNHDYICAITQISLTVIMFISYGIYAYQNHASLKNVKENHFRQHLIKLRNVFVVCGFIHVLSCVVSWFFAINYTIAGFTAFNILQMIMLISSKKNVLAIQQHLDGVHAIEQVEDSLALIAISQRAEVSEIKNTLATLEKILISER